MRLTDDRYAQQRYSMEVALRMIRHEARTATIRECTGISEDRIRKLYRSYFGGAANSPHRKRGKSPQQIHCLTHNLQARTDSALMASIVHSIGVLDEIMRGPNKRIDASAAAVICDAYELFAMLRPTLQPSDFSLEHAWFLIRALAEGTEIAATHCSRCAGLTVQDIYAPPRPLCPTCEIKRLADPRKPPRRRTRASRSAAQAGAEE
jgi:DNA-directed RNA polymerase subunit RPC12/RpoP